MLTIPTMWWLILSGAFHNSRIEAPKVRNSMNIHQLTNRMMFCARTASVPMNSRRSPRGGRRSPERIRDHFLTASDERHSIFHHLHYRKHRRGLRDHSPDAREEMSRLRSSVSEVPQAFVLA
ncbi:MAG TPA: hypothetical protein VMO26_10385 [Vicinamibacterales bacterium]|nr:hypothetical protein [Vicinamibacterales bacterium]